MRLIRSFRHSSRVLLLTELVVVVLLIATSTASAQPVYVVALASTLDEVLNNIRNWIIGIAAAIATVCFSIGGLRLLINGSEPGEVDKAKASFKAGGVGFAIAMLAPLLVAILKTLVGER
ncbi:MULTISPECIES: pilin [Lentzea]|uniref:Pilin n=1 Tax=Lentzea sokolovensis TaxID=3095429 RepID=A0ABU4VBS8_9PSEU|nr:MULTISPECIES: pilin [unclassified Lentzea]MCX2948958.1 pilin [Lentzea sp. NEAU-D7]MDX8148396.1 pilin [Lentzea sp. BCCO 10_0061]